MTVDVGKWLKSTIKLAIISIMALAPLVIIGLYKLYVGCPRALGDCYVPAWHDLWPVQAATNMAALIVWFGVIVAFIWNTARLFLTIAFASRASPNDQDKQS